MEELVQDAPINHKEYKDQILKALNDNRGNRHISASQISSQIWKTTDYKLKPKETEAYLFELIDENMVKKVKGKSVKIGKESVPGTDTYYIIQVGIEYVENSFNKLKSKSDISKLVDHVERTNELLTSILEASHMSIEEQQRHSELLSQLTDALQNKDDSKARSVLKEGLDAGKQVALPLLVEYLKSMFIPGA